MVKWYKSYKSSCKLSGKSQKMIKLEMYQREMNLNYTQMDEQKVI